MKQTQLPEHLSETLALVRGTVTATELNERKPNVSREAFSNRLKELLELGLVKRERFGKFWKYSRVNGR